MARKHSGKKKRFAGARKHHFPRRLFVHKDLEEGECGILVAYEGEGDCLNSSNPEEVVGVYDLVDVREVSSRVESRSLGIPWEEKE
jgi:hypothetical protein